MSNKVYDILKWIAQIVLPAASTLYFTLASIWGFPNTEYVIGSIAAVETFLGIILGVSTAQYNKFNNIDIGRNKTDNYTNNK
jgi:hypothetical protein